MPAPRRTVRAAGLPPAAAAPARLRVGIIGAGRVGAVLGAALTAAGHDVVAASGLSAASAERAARLLPGVPLLPADEVVAAADLVVLAVPDDTLAGLVAGLAETGAWRPGQLTFHTSGAHGLAVLAPAARAGVLPLALHPLLTAALDNGLRRGDRGLTGPVSRGDVGTVSDHLETLTERAPQAVAAYVAMARRTTERALAAGRLKRHEGAPLLDLLREARDNDAAGSR